LEIGILKKLNERRGNALLLACAIVICLLLLSSAIMEYIRLTIIANGVHDALQAAVISVSTGNYDETYNSLREGYSGGYNKVGGAWREKLDKGDMYAELVQESQYIWHARYDPPYVIYGHEQEGKSLVTMYNFTSKSSSGFETRTKLRRYIRKASFDSKGYSYLSTFEHEPHIYLHQVGYPVFLS